MTFGKLPATDNDLFDVTPKDFALLKHSNCYVKYSVGKDKK